RAVLIVLLIARAPISAPSRREGRHATHRPARVPARSLRQAERHAALRAMPPRVNWYSVSRSPALAAAAGTLPLIRASSATITERGVNAVPSSGNIRRACNPSISAPACFPIAAARIERNLLTVSMRRSRLARDHFREHLIQ